MRNCFRAFIAIAVIAFAGCAAENKPVPAPPPKGSAPELSGRFQAAKAISESNARDLALSRVAWQSAQTGDAQMVLNCVGAMNDPAARDNAAAKCASRLAQDGWTPQAVVVAKTIGDPHIRDRTLSKIAESGPAIGPQ